MRRLLGSGRVHLTLRPVEAADITAQYAFVICARTTRPLTAWRRKGAGSLGSP